MLAQNGSSLLMAQYMYWTEKLQIIHQPYIIPRGIAFVFDSNLF